MSENRFDFLRELVKNIPDINVSEDLSSSECASPGSPNQLEINLQPQEPIQISISSAAVAAAAAFKPNNNNNTNGSNLVRNGHRGMLHSKSVDLPHQQQQHWDNSIYTTNRPFNNLGNLSEDGTNIPTTSQAKPIGPNFYTEISDSSLIQYSTNFEPENNDFCVKPPKFTRLDSAPSIMSSTSHFKCKNSETPLNLTKTATYNDFTKLTGKINKRKTDPPPLLAPIIKTSNLKNNSIDFSLPSTSKNIPSPPVIKLDICNSPVVKIDYSNLASLSPTSFGHNNILPSPSIIVNTGITNSTYNQSPIINIDFSNINSFSFNTKPTAVLNQQMPSTPSNSALEMDEDYDNI